MFAPLSPETREMMETRFGRDTLIALATIDADMPCVRAVNAYYEDGSFYVVTCARSGKMRQLAANPKVAVCGEWFTGHGVGENLGHVLLSCNAVRMDTLRRVFASWYGNGHVDERDPETVLLRVVLTDGVLLMNGRRYEIDFNDDA